MTSYATMALIDLVDAFASSDPVPGGGSAAALAGAVGASLLLMVAGMEKTRTGTPEESADLSEASARLRPLRDNLVTLIDRDSDAYAAVVNAYALPKGDDAGTAARHTAIQRAMHAAAEVPLETMRECQQALRGAVTVARTGSRRAASDVGVAIELLLAGLRGAACNVDINVASLTDGEVASRLREERNMLERDGTADADTARQALG